jgi:hypothetical protein
LIPTNSVSNTKKYKEMNRRISINTIGLAVPQSFITKSKQRLKQQIDTVYLNDGDEFEIELYNPTQNKVLAKIEMNGNSIGNGIILRPGERVFLERYLDVAKKFLFETYVVNGNNDEVPLFSSCGPRVLLSSTCLRASQPLFYCPKPFHLECLHKYS